MSRGGPRVARRTEGEVRAHLLRSIEYDTNGGCWLWSASTQQGYGSVRYLGQRDKVHRVSYRIFRGAIPAGLTIDHLCRVRCCINPAHLDVVPLSENVRRSHLTRERPTHCRRGHELAGSNIRTRPTRYGGTHRQCRICERQLRREREASQ